MSNQSELQDLNNEYRGLIDKLAGKAIAGAEYTAGSNISIENNVISVDTTNVAEKDNTKPITSHGVYTVVGNINALLETI